MGSRPVMLSCSWPLSQEVGRPELVRLELRALVGMYWNFDEELHSLTSSPPPSWLNEKHEV